MFFQPHEHYSIPDENEYTEWITNVSNELESVAVTGRLNICDDKYISYMYCRVENEIGSVVIVHGYTEYYKKYYETAWYFLNEGYSVFMYDQRGHGYSSRIFENCQVVHINRFEEYSEDLAEFMDNIVFPNSNTDNINIYSHSMGGAVSALYLVGNKKINKTIMSSPMVDPITMGVPGKLVKRKALKDCKKYGEATKFQYTHSFSPNVDFAKSSDFSPSRFKYNLDMRIADKNYQTSGGSNRWVYESLCVRKKLMDSASEINSEVLMFISGKDKVVKIKPQFKYAEKLPNCRTIFVPGAKHSLYTHRKEYLVEYYKEIFKFLK